MCLLEKGRDCGLFYYLRKPVLQDSFLSGFYRYHFIVMSINGIAQFWEAGVVMKKLEKFGQVLVMLNFVYCIVMAAIDAIHNQVYFFTSEYFIGGAIIPTPLNN